MKYDSDKRLGSFCSSLDWPKDVDGNLKHKLNL